MRTRTDVSCVLFLEGNDRRKARKKNDCDVIGRINPSWQFYPTAEGRSAGALFLFFPISREKGRSSVAYHTILYSIKLVG